MRKLIIISSLALGAGIWLACGSGASGEHADSNAARTSMLQAPIETEMACSRVMAAVFQVDLAVARALVPKEYELITSQGASGEMAQLTITAIECETFTWEGVNYPTNMLMAVLDITGPADGDPTPGIAYGYNLLEQVTSPAFHARVAGHGERATLVKSIDLGGPPANNRQGSVVEADGTLETWLETDVTIAPAPIPIPLNATQYWRVGKGANAARVAGELDCVENINGVGAIGGLMHPVRVTADPDSKIGKLGFGTVLMGAGFDGTGTCTGSLYRISKQ